MMVRVCLRWCGHAYDGVYMPTVARYTL